MILKIWKKDTYTSYTYASNMDTCSCIYVHTHPKHRKQIQRNDCFCVYFFPVISGILGEYKEKDGKKSELESHSSLTPILHLSVGYSFFLQETFLQNSTSCYSNMTLLKGVRTINNIYKCNGCLILNLVLLICLL